MKFVKISSREYKSHYGIMCMHVCMCVHEHMHTCVDYSVCVRAWCMCVYVLCHKIYGKSLMFYSGCKMVIVHKSLNDFCVKGMLLL